MRALLLHSVYEGYIPRTLNPNPKGSLGLRVWGLGFGVSGFGFGV